MKVVKIVLFLLIFVLQPPVVLFAADRAEIELPLLYSVYDSSPMMIKSTPQFDESSSDILVNPDASQVLLKSPRNPWYYIDKNSFPDELDQRMLCAMIERHGSIDINLAIREVKALSVPLHPSVDNLFWRLVCYYQGNPYIGNMDSNQKSAAGWFGGISMNTFLMLSELAEIQISLSKEKKIRVLGIGSGGAFFES